MWQTIADFLCKWPILLLLAAAVWFALVIGVIAGTAWLVMLAVSALTDFYLVWKAKKKNAGNVVSKNIDNHIEKFRLLG